MKLGVEMVAARYIPGPRAGEAEYRAAVNLYLVFEIAEQAEDALRQLQRVRDRVPLPRSVDPLAMAVEECSLADRDYALAATVTYRSSSPPDGSAADIWLRGVLASIGAPQVDILSPVEWERLVAPE